MTVSSRNCQRINRRQRNEKSVFSADDDPLACVDPDIRDAFVGLSGFGVESTINRAAPAWFPEQLPDELILIGNSSGGHGNRVAFKTTLAPTTAASRLVQALEAVGWQRVDQRLPDNGGFRSRQTPREVPSLCHDKLGNAQIMARARDSDTLVQVFQREQRSSCRSHNQIQQAYQQSDQSLMPTLDLPADAKNHVGSGHSSSGRDQESRTEFRSNSSPGQLQSFFAKQLQEQGWTADAQWQGSVSVGSAWTNTTEQDDLLSGLLRIDVGTDNRYKVRFGLGFVE